MGTDVPCGGRGAGGQHPPQDHDLDAHVLEHGLVSCLGHLEWG